MKKLLVLTCLLFGNLLIIKAQPSKQPSQQPPQQQPQSHQQTPKEKAKVVKQMQAEAKKFTVPQIKTALETSPNPILFAKQILEKKFRIDTIVVTKTRNFSSLADSLAYTGKEKKVYGPYGEKGSRV